MASQSEALMPMSMSHTDGQETHESIDVTRKNTSCSWLFSFYAAAGPSLDLDLSFFSSFASSAPAPQAGKDLLDLDLAGFGMEALVAEIPQEASR